MESNTNLSEIQKDILREFTQISAVKITNSISAMSKEIVKMEVVHSDLYPVEKIPKLFENDFMASGIMLDVTGDINGYALTILPSDFDLLLVDIIMNRKIGTTTELDELAAEGLRQLGSISIGHSLSAMTEFIGLRLVESNPSLIHGNVHSILEQFYKKTKNVKEAFVLGLRFSTKKLKITGYFFYTFPDKDTKKILSTIEKKWGSFIDK
jgi:chemotaxis protein CheY-P-specific phosphatase CheC